MKNMKILFIILLACSQIKSAALESEFVMNIAQSLKSSKALAQMVNLDNNPLGKNRDSSYQYDKNSATGKFSQGSQGNQSVSPEQVAQAKAYSDKMAQENNNGKQTTQSNSDKSYDKKSTADKKPAVTPADKSTFLSWLNPTRYAAGVDQNNPAVQHLSKIEAAIQDYYDNSVWFGKSTGNTVAQGKAKSEIERLVAEYRKQLDANDKDFVAYKSTFEDMIKDAQSQFSNLKLQEANNPLFTSFSDLLSKLNPFSSKPESADVNNEASKLMQKMEDALAMYYDNTTNVIQKMYQSKDVTDNKEQNKAAAMTKFQELAGEYNRYQKSPDFVAKNDEFKALFAHAQEVFGYENSSNVNQNKPAAAPQSAPTTPVISKPAPTQQPTDKSTFVSWLNPTRYAAGVDQNNPAVQHLNKIESAIQDYYDNSVWFGKSTGNTVAQGKAKSEIERLVAEYRKQLDANDKDFVAYKSTFVDMIKDAQSQFSNLNLDPAKEPLFTSFSDLLSKLNPFSSKPESADVNNEASKLMQKMEDALAMYYDNTTNVIQKMYQSKEVTDKKEMNKSAAMDTFKDLAADYNRYKNKKEFVAKNDDFKALFDKAQEVFGYESNNQTPADSMYTQVSQYMSSFFAPQNKPAAAPQPAPATPIISKPAPAAPALQQPEPEAAASSSQDDTTERPEQKALNQDQMYRAKMEDAIQQYDENNRNPKEQANALNDFKKAVSDYINNLGQYYSDSYGHHHITAKDDQKKLIQGRADLDKLLQSIKEDKSFGEDNTLNSIEVPLNFYNGIKTESKKVSLRDIQTFINRG